MKRWNWIYNGFHGRTHIRLMVCDGAEAGSCIRLSAAVAHRINRQVCGFHDCPCGEAVVHGWDAPKDFPGASCAWIIELPEQGTEQRGQYPQA